MPSKVKRMALLQRIKYAIVGIDKLFLGIAVLNIIGGIGFYKETGSTVYIPIIVGFLGYLFGYCINVKPQRRKLVLKGKRFVGINSKCWDGSRAEFATVWILFVVFFVVGYSLFIERGIPLFNSFDNALRSSFGDGTHGRIRALCVGLPMISIYMFLLHQKTGNYKKSFYMMFACTIIGLGFYSYKAYILWFVIVMFYTYYYVKKNDGADLKLFKWIVLGVLTVICLVALFSIWLAGHDTAATAFINRILYDEIAGFNYVYTNYVPERGFMNGEFLLSELNNILFRVNTNGYSFMETLATLYYGRPVTWGIVITIYGCFYIDYGNIGVFVGMAVFGFCLKSISNYLNNFRGKRNINVVCMIMLISFMGFIFQNGSIINEIRGTVLSIVIVKVLYEFILSLRLALNKSRTFSDKYM